MIGIALNTILMTDEAAKEYMKKTEEETGLPVTDVVRYGGDKIFSQLI